MGRAVRAAGNTASALLLLFFPASLSLHWLYLCLRLSVGRLAPSNGRVKLRACFASSLPNWADSDDSPDHVAACRPISVLET